MLPFHSLSITSLISLLQQYCRRLLLSLHGCTCNYEYVPAFSTEGRCLPSLRPRGLLDTWKVNVFPYTVPHTNTFFRYFSFTDCNYCY
ncbi:hypothetical protein EDC04DRAFT_2683811 [Pisolithus marmoratus]|nr:hypothetical protein EDC04DRAFT_2683811 [Pisolithus marmoratus]